MLKVENTTVMNFDGAFRGMRNPLNSWDKSDSFFGYITEEDWEPIDCITRTWVDYASDNRVKKGYHILEEDSEEWDEVYENYFSWLASRSTLSRDCNIINVAYLGPKDLDLAQRLVESGTDHSKFMRQIFVYVDITAPIYWWKEMDTYKVGTVANSTSTMHKITSEPITKDFFSLDENLDNLFISGNYTMAEAKEDMVFILEKLRKQYLETNDKRYWRALIQMLPESWNQTRTWTCNYQNLRNIYFSRKSHKLEEWHSFCHFIENLPYGKELITIGGKK